MSERNICFISDIHLGYDKGNKETEKEQLLIDFLKKIKDDVSTIVIAGDLFDYWFDYSTVVPKDFVKVLAVLHEVKDKRINIEYLMGNHDFGHWLYFENDLGIKIHEGDIEREWNGKKFYISHGDAKSYNDAGYRILKKILRSRISNFLYRKLHPDWGIGIALSSSRESRKHTDNKNYGPDDGMKDFAEAKIKEGFDYVIMGHRHILEETKFENGTYFNLGSWFKEPVFGLFDGENMKIVKVRDYLQNGLS